MSHQVLGKASLDVAPVALRAEVLPAVDTVLSRGKVIVDGGEYLGAKGDGRYLKRGLSQYLT